MNGTSLVARMTSPSNMVALRIEPAFIGKELRTLAFSQGSTPKKKHDRSKGTDTVLFAKNMPSGQPSYWYP